MSKLKTLNLGSNEFNASVMTFLNNLSSLRNLDLSNNPLSGLFPAQGTGYDYSLPRTSFLILIYCFYKAIKIFVNVDLKITYIINNICFFFSCDRIS